MSVFALLIALIVLHLYLQLGVMACLYLIPVERFENGAGYRFWPPDARGRWGAAAGAFVEFWVAYLFIVTYPLGWLWPKKIEKELHPEKSDPRNAPIVLVHGYMMNSLCMVPLRHYLRFRGFRRLYTVNLKNLAGPIEALARQLRKQVLRVAEKNPHAQLSLIGHSLGGVVSAKLLGDPEAAPHLKRVIAVGSPFSGTIVHRLCIGICGRQMRPGGIFLRRLAEELAKGGRKKLISIYSEADRLVLPPRSSHVEGAQAIMRLRSLGHLSLLLSPAVFELLHGFLIEARSAAASADVEPADSRPVLVEKGVSP